ncbi:hypothetical protein PC123_g3689 [Phytophthora cactorum]|nr:hypothetical protein PC123_g3689 [Phytophthora cactorum]
MTDLAKEIRILVDNYVRQTDDQELQESWQKLQSSGEQRRADSTASSASGTRTSPGQRPARRRHTGEKRQRQSALERDVQRSDNIHSEDRSSRAGVQTSLGQTATGLDEDRPRRPAGRQTRSRTAAAGVTVIPRSNSSRSTRRRMDQGQRSLAMLLSETDREDAVCQASGAV